MKSSLSFFLLLFMAVMPVVLMSFGLYSLSSFFLYASSMLIIFCFLIHALKALAHGKLIKFKGVSFLFSLFFLYGMVIAAGLFMDFEKQGVIRLVQWSVSASVFFVFFNMTKDMSYFEVERSSSFLIFICFFLLCLYIAAWFLKWVPQVNSNVPPFIISFLSFLGVAFSDQNKNKQKICFFLVVSAISIAFLYSARAVILVSVFFLIVNIVMRGWVWRVMFWQYFLLVSMLIFTWMFFSISHADSSFAALLNGFSREYLGSNIFSGRDLLWSQAFESIKNNPWFGSGISTLYGQSSGAGMSAHNLYFQVGVQSGIIGMAAIYFVFFMLLFYIRGSALISESRVFYAIILSVMIFQVFNVSLTQNLYAIGFMIWSVLGASGLLLRNHGKPVSR